MTKQKITVLTIISLCVVGIVNFGFTSDKGQDYHDEAELMKFQAMAASSELPLNDNGLFSGSGTCAGCHGNDPLEYAGLTSSDWDVNVTDHWRSSMMANAANDPFWKAKVSHEVAVNPDHQEVLEDKCTSCHAPLGNFGAHFNGATHYSMAMLALDSLGKDGVSCLGCHQQDPENAGNIFSGELEFVEDTVFGPYGGPEDDIPLFGQPMTSFVGYEPLYDAQFEKSETCAGCHTLSTNTADLDGNLTGGSFIEQATYHEWLNSIYSEDTDPEAQECQGCHMPRINDPVVISSNYAFLQGRAPYGLHTMVGANTFMLEMFRDNVEELDLSATAEQFDTTLFYTAQMLQEQSLELELDEAYYQDDTLALEVFVRNKAGHKFPSGYPSRRAFVEFILTDNEGNELFTSGKLQADYEVEGQNETFEPHYDVINNPEQVLIYEMVMGDVNGDVTTVLERADYPIKDNRLAPKGFTLGHEVYDTTLVAGTALTDPSWNHEDGVEGSGTDRVTYKVRMNGYEGEVNASARMYYQSLPPKWMDEMFATDTPEINYFEEKYNEQGADPVLVAEDSYSTTVTSVPNFELASISVYPNPSTDGNVTIKSPDTQM
ncbi:MAG: cytochrome c3 family protein, partial [Flavobacteriales bacterium]